MVEEEDNQNRKAEREDVIALAEKLGIDKGTCSWYNPVNAFVHMINALFMHELASDRVNQDCLMILIGQPMNQLKAIEKSYVAFEKKIKEHKDNYSSELKRYEKTKEKLDHVKWRNRHVESSNRFARVIAQMALSNPREIGHYIEESEAMFKFEED